MYGTRIVGKGGPWPSIRTLVALITAVWPDNACTTTTPSAMTPIPAVLAQTAQAFARNDRIRSLGIDQCPIADQRVPQAERMAALW